MHASRTIDFRDRKKRWKSWDVRNIRWCFIIPSEKTNDFPKLQPIVDQYIYIEANENRTISRKDRYGVLIHEFADKR